MLITPCLSAGRVSLELPGNGLLQCPASFSKSLVNARVCGNDNIVYANAGKGQG